MVGGEGNLDPASSRNPTAGVYARASNPQGSSGSPGILAGVRIAMVLAGLLLAAAGAVWVAQGLDLPFAPRSFMTREPGWVLGGSLAVLAGVGLAAWGWRRR